MKKKNLLLLLLAFALVLSTGVGTAWAYFTTYARAQGGYTIHLGSRTEIHEDIDNGGKHITIFNKDISNKQKSQPVYVRVKAFAGLELNYGGSGWHSGADGYWYYDKALYSGDTSSVLDVGYSIPKADKDMPDVNIVVIYESTPVTFDEKGKEVGWNNADWDAKLDVGTWKGGAK